MRPEAGRRRDGHAAPLSDADDAIVLNHDVGVVDHFIALHRDDARPAEHRAALRQIAIHGNRYALLDWLSYVEPLPHTSITPWNPNTGVVMALLLARGFDSFGWGLAWRIACWAHFHDAANCYSMIPKLLRYSRALRRQPSSSSSRTRAMSASSLRSAASDCHMSAC